VLEGRVKGEVVWGVKIEVFYMHECRLIKNIKITKWGQARWLTPIIPAAQEVEIGRSQFKTSLVSLRTYLKEQAGRGAECL
jgi:hypothetical protein